MRFGFLVLALVALLLAVSWLLRDPARGADSHALALTADPSSPPAPELSGPRTLVDTPAPVSSVSTVSAEARRTKPARPARTAETAVAPVRGRLVVAETGDPIEGLFSMRLRTIDLLRSEDLRTSSDGGFQSSTFFPRSVLLALVEDVEGRELVDQEAAFDPLSEDEWLVRVPESAWPTFGRGQVVDRRGNPIEGAKVSLVPLESGRFPGETAVERDGTFHLEPLRPGLHRLFLQGRWARAAPVELTLRTGPNDLGKLVVDDPAPAGDLVLTLAAQGSVRPMARFELGDEGGSIFQRFDTSIGGLDEGGRLRLTVPGLPAGRYTLVVRSLDGLVYEPASLRFSPPAALEIGATGAARPGHLFRARDARTGESLLGFSVFGRFERTWAVHSAHWRMSASLGRPLAMRTEEVRLPPGFDSWVVSATGYRAAFGRFAGSGETIVVDLEPGWSELYQFEDAGGDSFSPPGFERFLDPPVLSGVEVQVDGRLVGESDADGFFALSGEGEPDSIAFQKPGWLPVNEYTLDILRTVTLIRSP